jgi:hypothetical protein
MYELGSLMFAKSFINQSTEQRTFKNVSNSLNTNIYFYLETFGCQSFNLHLNVVQFFNTSVD